MIVICLCHNELRYTQGFVESVLKAKDDLKDVKIVMVDNGSTDGVTSGYLKTLSETNDNFVFRQNESNEWFTVACDKVIKEYPGEDVYLINNDVVVLDGWLSGREFLKEYGMLGAVQLTPGNLRMSCFYGGESDFMSHKQGWMWAVEEQGEIIDAEWLTFGACMINRRLYDLVGGLDSELRFYCSDSDLSLRMRASGAKIGVCRDMRVIHYGGQTTKGMSEDFKRSVWENSDQKRFAKKHKLKIMDFDYREEK